MQNRAELIEVEVDGHLETHHVRNLLRSRGGKWLPYDPYYKPPVRHKEKLSNSGRRYLAVLTSFFPLRPPKRPEPKPASSKRIFVFCNRNCRRSPCVKCGHTT